jgi:hypothetical protein
MATTTGFTSFVLDHMRRMTVPVTIDELRVFTGGDLVSVAAAVTRLTQAGSIARAPGFSRPVRYVFTEDARREHIAALSVPLPPPSMLTAGAFTPFGLVCGGAA